jgi:hypothetical protein
MSFPLPSAPRTTRLPLVLPAESCPPLPLACSYNHAACYDEENNRLVVFGGRTAERKRLNDVYFLDLDTWTWFKWVMGTGLIQCFPGTQGHLGMVAVGCFAS